MLELFIVSFVLSTSIFASQYMVYRVGQCNPRIFNPIFVGWIIGICAYELLDNALHMLPQVVAISIIFGVFIVSRCLHSFHTHVPSEICPSCEPTIEMTSHTRDIKNPSEICQSCEPTIEMISHTCDIKNTSFSNRCNKIHSTTNSTQCNVSRLHMVLLIQKHIAFGIHVFVDAILIGLAYNTPVFVGLSLAMGICMLQDTVALSMCLKQAQASRPHLQACMSVSFIACVGIFTAAIAPVPHIISSIACSVSIGILLNELSDFELTHLHGWQSVKQTGFFTFGAGIAVLFYVLTHGISPYIHPTLRS